MSVAYSDRTETEQDVISVEVLSNLAGDAEIVQKLLEQWTTKGTALYATSLAHSGARGMIERRPFAAVIREGTDGN